MEINYFKKLRIRADSSGLYHINLNSKISDGKYIAAILEFIDKKKEKCRFNYTLTGNKATNNFLLYVLQTYNIKELTIIQRYHSSANCYKNIIPVLKYSNLSHIKIRYESFGEELYIKPNHSRLAFLVTQLDHLKEFKRLELDTSRISAPDLAFLYSLNKNLQCFVLRLYNDITLSNDDLQLQHSQCNRIHTAIKNCMYKKIKLITCFYMHSSSDIICAVLTGMIYNRNTTEIHIIIASTNVDSGQINTIGYYLKKLIKKNTTLKKITIDFPDIALDAFKRVSLVDDVMEAQKVNQNTIYITITYFPDVIINSDKA